MRLFGLVMVGSLLEMLGIGLVVPALAFMGSEQTTAASPLPAAILRFLGNPSRPTLVVYGLAALVGVYALKSAFLVYVAWRQSKTLSLLSVDLSNRLFGLYLSQPWTFHLQRNSASLIHNIQSEVGNFSQVVSAMITICTDVLLTSAIGTLLLVMEPIGAVAVAAILGISTLLFRRLTTDAMYRWGAARQEHETQKFRHLQQGLGGIKDAKILGCEPTFVSEFARHNLAASIVGQRQTMLTQVPRLWFELVAVVGLSVLALVLLFNDTPTRVFIPTLGVFGAAAFRLMPSVNRLTNAWQSIRFGSPAVDRIYSELQLPAGGLSSPGRQRMRFDAAIELRGVSFRYANCPVDACHEISLRIPRGAAVGLIGESGAGKSTLVDVILGLLAPTGGAVLVDGVDIATNLRGWQNIVGYVPQTIYLSDDSIRSNVAFGEPADAIDDEAVAAALRAARLNELVAGLKDGVHTFVGERGVRLSGGQRQRIGIARALYRNPEVLVLDEATSALDTATEQGIMEAVNALHGEKTLIIVAHRLSTVAECDTLYKLEKGRLVRSGSFAEVVHS
jgi:ABC-type multidrug transport system fused ATPase/permease subunit